MINWVIGMRRFRESLELRQSELAETLGETQATISRWESGRQRPDLESLQALKPLLAQALLTSELAILPAVRVAPPSRRPRQVSEDRSR